MSQDPASTDSSARSEEERAALFAELMAEEQRTGPINGLAIVTLVVGVLGGLLAPVFGFFALVQIRDRRDRGAPLVYAGLGAFAVWVVVTVLLVVNGRAWWQTEPGEQPVSTLDLTVGECFDAPALAGETPVQRHPCDDWHTGEVFAVLPVSGENHPGVVELYEDSLTRCQAAAPDTAERVQAATPTPGTWRNGTHRVVCYVQFGHRVNSPLR